MLPNTISVSQLLSEFEENEQKSTQTFGINSVGNAIVNKIDGLDSLRQSIYLMLGTEADQYIIYPYTYGLKTIDLIGKPSHYVVAVLPNRIKETLASDGRILDVSDFEFEVNKNKLLVKFVVNTVYGKTTAETVVTY